MDKYFNSHTVPFEVDVVLGSGHGYPATGLLLCSCYIAATVIISNSIFTAVVNQLVGLLLDMKIFQGLRMGRGLLLHHATGFVLFVVV